MTKPECETAIKSLCHDWASEQTNADLVHPSFSRFRTWLEDRHYSHYLRFRSATSPLDDAERWFDDELRATRLRATVADATTILADLATAASPATKHNVSLREIVMRLERHTVTNDELDAVRKLKEAGPDPDAPLIEYARTVFAKRYIGVDGWPVA